MFGLYIIGDLGSLIGLDCDKTRLKIFKSDPFDYQSIIDALKGCSGLFYTFEPLLDHPIYDVSIHPLISIYIYTRFLFLSTVFKLTILKIVHFEE